jgi:hypothetical protein
MADDFLYRHVSDTPGMNHASAWIDAVFDRHRNVRWIPIIV